MRKIWNTMLKGLVAILPIGLTLYLVYWLAGMAERVFSGVIKLLIPAHRLLARPRAAHGPGRAVPGRPRRERLLRAPRAQVRRPAVRAHPGGEDDLRRDPRLHAVLPVLGQGQRPEARGAGAVRAGQGHRLRHVRVRGGARPRRRRRGQGRRLPAHELHDRRPHDLPAARPARADVAVGRGRHAHRADGRRDRRAELQTRTRPGPAEVRLVRSPVVAPAALSPRRDARRLRGRRWTRRSRGRGAAPCGDRRSARSGRCTRRCRTS